MVTRSKILIFSGFICTGGSLLGLPGIVQAQAGSAGTQIAQNQAAGTLISQESMPNAPQGVGAWRIHYLMADDSGQPVEATGAAPDDAGSFDNIRMGAEHDVCKIEYAKIEYAGFVRCADDGRLWFRGGARCRS